MSWNLLGHEWAETLFKQHLINDDVRHAYLLTGAPGIGRRSLALEFACALNCQQPPAPGEYCGVCRSCSQILKMQHPDLSIIQPETEGGMIKVEQIRNLQHSLSLSPFEAKYRVALLLNFQQANANAQNALLKTLEEAPRQVVLFLSADSAESLLPTIVSRCEILRLHSVPIAAVENILVSKWKIPQKTATLCAHLSCGRLGLAVRLAQNPDQIERRTQLLDDFTRLLPLSRRDRFAYVDTLARNRDEIRFALQTWYSYGRDLLMLTNHNDTEITNINREEELTQTARKVTSTTALKMVNAIDSALSALEANGHTRLLMDVFCLNLPIVRVG
ncbi:MAG: ATP-binding protein [Anaerolineaceae bacterium]